MKIFSILFIIAFLALEFMGIKQDNDTFNAWAFISCYFGAGMVLVYTSTRLEDGNYKAPFILMALGYFLRSAAEFGYEIGFFGTDVYDTEVFGSTDYSFTDNVVYYISSLLYATSAYLIHKKLTEILGIKGQRWPLISLVISILTVSVFSITSFVSGAYRQPGFFIEFADDIVSAFSAFLITIFGVLVLGGSYGRPLLPLAAAFFSLLVGNVWYSALGVNYVYNYGDPPDYFWLLESALIMLIPFFLVKNNEEEEF